MARMRLLVLADARSIHTARWCEYFVQAGFEVGLFSLEEKKITTLAKFFPATSRTPIKFLNYYLAKKDFLHAVEQFRPDVINPHFVVSYGYLASFCQTIPIANCAWGSDLLLMPSRSPFHKWRIARALRSGSVCFVDGSNLVRVASEYIAKDKTYPMVWGVDREVLSQPLKSNGNGGKLNIIAPRGLPDVYDPQTIINAAGLLRGKLDFKISMRGEEALIPRYQKMIEARNLNSLIELKPFIKNHAEHLSALPSYDLYLSASLSDSTSVSLLEAMAVGLFPVVSDIPGNGEWITGGENGLTFKPGSAEDLVKAILKASRMQKEFDEVARRNRAIIEERAIWQDQMMRVEKIIAGLVQ